MALFINIIGLFLSFYFLTNTTSGTWAKVFWGFSFLLSALVVSMEIRHRNKVEQ